MVVSLINNSIFYDEDSRIYKDDINHEASLYEIQVDDVDIDIVLGKQKNEYIENEPSIIYFPIYLAYKDKILSRIGIFEVLSNDITDVYDDDGDLDLDKVSLPRIFSFVNKDYLSDKAIKNDPEPEPEPEPEPTANEEPEDEPNANEESEDEDEVPEDEEYEPDEDSYWVTRYLKDKKYTFKDNEGGGDCLFAVIRDALKNTDMRDKNNNIVEVDVAYLRNIIANEATEDIYNNYKELFDNYKSSMIEDNAKIKQITSEIKTIVKTIKETKDHIKSRNDVTKAKTLRDDYNRLKEEKQVTSNLIKEVEFMNGVDNMDKFREILKTSKFWADTWAIGVLERVLNIKMIILARDNYIQGDIHNVMQCGQFNDDVIQKQGVFNPDKYIMLDYLGQHYILIKYKGDSTFKFSDIPEKIKELISDKCMESDDSKGPFHLIPEFKEYNRLRKGIADNNEDNNQENNEDNGDDSRRDNTVDLNGNNNWNIEKLNSSYEDLNLYDDNIVFQFYSYSADVDPGKGTGEKIPADLRKGYVDLSRINDWRRQLSNFYVAPFYLDRHKWNTVEHYYQGSKFKLNNYDFYVKFSLDGSEKGSELANDPGLAKVAGDVSKKVKESLRPKDIKIDPDFNSTGRGRIVMLKALTAKFTQNKELADMLIKTKDARLMHYIKGSPPEELTGLMKIRKALIENKYGK